MKKISNFNKNKISIGELQKYLNIVDYRELVKTVEELIENNQIKPIKSSGINGKKPSLYRCYFVIREKSVLTAELNDELLYQLSPELDNSYYLNHINQYLDEREHVLELNRYLIEKPDSFAVCESVNERSFEIFGREKYLSKEGGKTLLAHLSFKMEQLNVYETSEPVAYFSNHKRTPQTILFIENKDTFYSMRKYLLDGNEMVLGVPVGTLIYGGGKKILKSLQDFNISVEPYMLDTKNEYLYFGDLDHEGIIIYENLYCQELAKNRCVKPFTKAYLAMVDKTQNMHLPATKDGQNRNLQGVFKSFFTDDDWKRMKCILDSNLYIPQECLVSSDFAL